MSLTDLIPSVSTGGPGPDPQGDALIAEILEVLDSNRHFIDLDAYLSLRRLGGTHKSIVELFDRGCPMGYITEGLKAGVTSEELTAIGYPWDRAGYYVKIRQAGQTHQDALQAVTLNIQTSAYLAAINAGADHGQIVEFAAVSPLVRDYATARSSGIPHDQLLSGIALGITPALQVLDAQERLP
jgi:hypothetical protein